MKRFSEAPVCKTYAQKMTETPMISVMNVEQRPRPQQKLENVTDLNTESAHPEVTLVAIQKKRRKQPQREMRDLLW